MPGKQVQSQRSPFLRGGLEYCPQGFGSHGSSSMTGSTAKKISSLDVFLQTLLKIIFDYKQIFADKKFSK
jgi:hypothetical protein